MATFLRNNSSSSISSLSSVGSDNNADVIGKGGKNAAPTGGRNLVQRTRDALGDIGNRLKKNPAAIGGKAPAIKKATVGAKKDFAVPTNRPPRAAAPKVKAPTGTKTLTKSVSKAKKEASAPTPVEDSSETNKENSKATTVLKSDVSVKTEKCTKQVLSTQTEDKENVALVVAQPKTGKSPFSKHVEELVENEYNPKLSTEVAVEAFSTQRLDIVNIDVDEWNPLLVQGYVKEIYNYVFELEKKYPIRIRYLEGRLINSRMRAVLLDWLIEVHAQFGFMKETLYLAAKIMDRYLQADRNVTRKQLQLVGVTAMYIAAKYEEVCTPAVQDFAAVSDNAFTIGDVKKMEQDMLKTLSFDLAFPPAVLFLRRFSKAANANMAIHSMAKFIVELSLVDYVSCHLFPSEKAVVPWHSHFYDKSLSELWNPTVQHYSRFSIESIKPIVSLLSGVVSRAQEENQKLKAVHNKYTKKRLSYASVAPELKVELWRNRVLKEVLEIKRTD